MSVVHRDIKVMSPPADITNGRKIYVRCTKGHKTYVPTSGQQQLICSQLIITIVTLRSSCELLANVSRQQTSWYL